MGNCSNMKYFNQLPTEMKGFILDLVIFYNSVYNSLVFEIMCKCKVLRKNTQSLLSLPFMTYISFYIVYCICKKLCAHFFALLECYLFMCKAYSLIDLLIYGYSTFFHFFFVRKMGIKRYFKEVRLGLHILNFRKIVSP